MNKVGAVHQAAELRIHLVVLSLPIDVLLCQRHSSSLRQSLLSMAVVADAGEVARTVQDWLEHLIVVLNKEMLHTLKNLLPFNLL